jgi:dipeptidyl aminopeptidase/acylaminoacyl peptidase
MRRPTPVIALALALVAGRAVAQEPYRLPPKVVMDILDAPPPPALSVSPDRAWLLLADRQSMPTIAELAEPMLRLAGQRVNPVTNGPHRAQRYVALHFKRLVDGLERPIATPPGATLGMPMWSPDGRRVAFTVTRDAGIELWVASLETGAARAVTRPVLNATLGAPCTWMPDSAELLCRLVPDGRGAPPQPSPVPVGPHLQASAGRGAPVRTYEDLLKNADDERLFDYYMTSQLARVSAESAFATPIGKPGVYDAVDPSPDGDYVLVQRLARPYSYLVPSYLFPRVVEVWDRSGRAVRRVAELPLGDRIPIRGVRAGPRQVQWRPGVPATLVYAVALDGGDPRVQVPYRDKVEAVRLPAGDSIELARTELRFGGIAWGERDALALLTEMDRPARRTRTWVLDVTRPTTAPRQLFDRSTEDRYGDPGRPLLRPSATGDPVLLESPDGRFLFLAGAGASPDGDHPFLDRLDLRTLTTTRLFRSADPYYESVITVLDARGPRVLTSRETGAEPPNYVVRDLGAGTARAVTDFRDPAPQLRGVRRELVTYRRADGLQLSATLFLPPGYVAGTRLPLVLWVYPAEFRSADAASQVRGSANRFTRLTGPSHLFLLTQGYAVLDNPSLPIVGGDTANDSYVQQVVLGAWAAIDKMVEMGVSDGWRIGVGGHSYGAFTTANLLAHSDLFRTGIARSGAYNRTLTPFGFQNEQRTYWQARDVYTEMSPFSYADRINEPILLMHGEADDNSGTFPIQSDRMYQALKGLGATVTLVTYPDEAHGYAARETVLDCVAWMIEWYDRYVKNAAARQ